MNTLIPYSVFRCFALCLLLAASTAFAADSDGDGVDDTTDAFPYDASRSMANTNILYTLNAISGESHFGRSVSGAGDINKDGYTDLIAGADNLLSRGTARVLSGKTGATLYTFNGGSPLDQFGISVSGAGDVNSDGYPDVIVGAYQDDTGIGTGSARVLSGKTGAILYTFVGPDANTYFGYSVSGAGDVNQDGYADVIVGAYEYDSALLTNAGTAQVRSGKTGASLANYVGLLNHNSSLGFSVSGAGDVNGDGYAEVIIGAPGGSGTGTADVRSSGFGNYFSGDSTGDKFGYSVSDAGDVNGDGYADVIVGAPYDDNNGTDSGSARVLNVKDSVILYTFDGDSAGDQLGYSVSGAGDVNGDGYADIFVGAPMDDNSGSNSGSARVFSGKDGAILYTFNGDSAGDQLGYSVSDAGDVNGDGYGDLVAGSHLDDNSGPGPDTGSVRVFSGKGLWTDADGDGQNDAVDSDDDNDGTLDINDLTPVGIDTDGDGISDLFDWDDDNDGVPDNIDIAPLNPGDASEIVLPLNGAYKGMRLENNVVH